MVDGGIELSNDKPARFPTSAPLLQRVGRAAFTSSQIASAERVIKTMVSKNPQHLAELVAGLREAARRLSQECTNENISACFAFAHELSGLGKMFEKPLITVWARSLCHFLNIAYGAREDIRDVIGAHVTAIGVVASPAAAIDDNLARQVEQELDRAIAKFTAHAARGRLVRAEVNNIRPIALEPPPWRFEAAAKAIDALELEGPCSEIARYWLSLWRGDEGPLYRDFDPARLGRDVLATAIFGVHEQSLTCRVAGHLFDVAMGLNLKKCDLIALTPPTQRKRRLSNVTSFVRGAVMSGVRRFDATPAGVDDVCQEVFLPFADVAEDGARRYLMHSNWRPSRRAVLHGDQPPADFTITQSPSLIPIY